MTSDRAGSAGLRALRVAGLACALAGLARAGEGPGRVREILADKCLACHSPDPRKGGPRPVPRELGPPGRRERAGDRPGQARREPADREGRGRRDAAGPAARARGGRRVPGLGRGRGAPTRSSPWPPAGPGPTGGRSGRSAGPRVPTVRDRAWVRTPVDAFVLARLERDGLAPAPEADRATCIRRVTFDLTGLPPTPEEVDAFVADAAPDAYERLVDRLLASPRLRRALGAALARRGPVRREPRLRDEPRSGPTPGPIATT